MRQIVLAIRRLCQVASWNENIEKYFDLGINIVRMSAKNILTIGPAGEYGVITHRHFRRADRDEAPDFRVPLPWSPISESMCAWIAPICSA